MADITVVGGGLAGLVASIASAEAGAKVHLYEAHATLGGRARSTPPPFIAHDGPHVIYADGPFWAWLAERDLCGPAARPPLGALAGLRFRRRETLGRRPPLSILRLLAPGEPHRWTVTSMAGWRGPTARRRPGRPGA